MTLDFSMTFDNIGHIKSVLGISLDFSKTYDTGYHGESDFSKTFDTVDHSDVTKTLEC